MYPFMDLNGILMHKLRSMFSTVAQQMCGVASLELSLVGLSLQWTSHRRYITNFMELSPP
jgi:hypothetical protein